jgi:N-acetylmuramoyl-L-alanine amidase
LSITLKNVDDERKNIMNKLQQVAKNKNFLIFWLLISGTVLLVSLQYNCVSVELIKITFPTEEYLQKELPFDKIRFAGVTLPDSKVYLGGKELKVYKSGAFVGLLELLPGKNEFVFTAQTPVEIATYTLVLFRKQPTTTSPERPPVIEEGFFVPEKDVTLSVGDLLRLQFKGSPNGKKAECKIKGLRKRIKLVEKEGEIKGIYVGHYVINDAGENYDKVKNSEIKFILTTKYGKVEKICPARITILPRNTLLVGEVVEDDTYFLMDVDTSRPCPYSVLKNTKLVITGKIGEYYRVALSRNLHVWINEKSVKLFPEGVYPLPAVIYSITVATAAVESGSIKIKIPISEKVPVMVDENLYPPETSLTVFYAKVDSGWVTQYLEEKNIKFLKIIQQDDETVKITLSLKDFQPWGSNVYYEDKNLIWEVKVPPKINLADPVSPLRGLKVFVDPGHGGKESGAVGATGLKEKDVNLDISLTLAEKLRSCGAEVVCSRSGDETISWQERFKLARNSKADIYLCIHVNSIPETWDPLRVRGVSTFYNYASGMNLAKCILARFTAELGLPKSYYIYRHPYRNQPTGMVFVLVEVGFISHPEDELILLEKRFREKISEAIYNGLIDFLSRKY